MSKKLKIFENLENLINFQSKRTISILMLMIFLIGSLPIIFAEENTAVGVKKVKTGIPIVFSIENTSDDTDDNADDPTDNQQTVTASSSGGGGGGRRILNTTKRAYIRKAIAASVAEHKLKNIDRIVKEKPTVTELLQNLSDNQLRLFTHLSRAQKERVLVLNKVDAIKAISEYQIKPINKSMMFKKRVIATAKLKIATKNYGLAVREYAKYNSIYKEKSVSFHEAKERLRGCVGDESDECNELREQTQEYAKEYLINGAKISIEHLNKIKAKIEGSEEIDEEKAEEMIADINNAIAKLEDAIAQVEAAQTKDEVKDAAKAINRIWKAIKHKERMYAARLVYAKVWNIIRRSEHLEERLDKILAEMEEQEIDVSDINDMVDQFSEEITEAKDKFKETEDLLRKAHSLITNSPDEDEITEVTKLVEQAKELLKEAHQSLKDAHRLLVQIIKDIKDAGGEITPETEDEELYEVVETEVVE